jgi:hypothetical protein
MIIGTVDQEAATAGGAHFPEGSLLAGEFGHAPSKRARRVDECGVDKTKKPGEKAGRFASID